MHCHNVGSNLKIFLKMLQLKRVEEVCGKYINGFFKKFLFLGKCTILGPKMMHCLGPLTRFSTRAQQNACVNTVRRAMMCYIYFPFPQRKITLLEGLCAYA